MSAGDRLRRAGRRAGVGAAEGDSPPVSVTLASAAVAVAVLSPVLWILLRAADVGVDSSLALLARPSMVDILLNSVGLVTVVTVACVLLGVPLAVLTVQTDLPFRRFWTVALALPLVVPSYIGAFAFVSAFGPRGALADALAPLGVESIPQIYGFAGTALVLTLYVYPYVFLTTRAALLSFDGTLVEAARTLNHSRREAFRRVTLPQIAPGIAAGALLVALYTLSDFGTPSIMHFGVFTRAIYVEFNTFGRDTAALLSLELLAVTAVIVALESRVGGRDSGSYAGGGGSAARTPLGAWKLPALVFCAAVVLLALVVPLGVLAMWLVRSGPGYAGGGFAFDWTYGWNSASVSALAAAVATLAAVPVAYLAARYRSALTSLFDRATYVGYATPGIVLGISLVYFGSSYAPALYQTIPLLVFAYVVRFLPQAVGTTRSSVLQVDAELLEAARTLGRPPGEAFRRVTLPLIAPGVVAGAALVFLTTMKELPATLLLRPTGFETLVTYIWRVQEAGYYGQAAVPALALVGVSALSMLVLLKQDGSLVRQEGGTDD
ncbi:MULTISPECIES: iron ABC transporter permease [Halorussus]|uniref:ABC transporter permease n=1 Tax=Halorussus TaxID=1070314 RepID=UPI000E21741C|nr:MULTISPECIES: iron ABC transporter permease [Halorussus]NHN58711.1 iron ABC transporter permease [Halorussus sp. JP-T4]